MVDKLKQFRAGEPWTDERNAELVELLRTNLTTGQIADRAGRTTSAIQGRCRAMLPRHIRATGERAVVKLSELVNTPGYDWREPLREHAQRGRSTYWDIDMDVALVQGWEQSRPLAELCREFGASEIEIARQLLRLAVAENMCEVADRLGCDPEGVLAARLRLQADRDTAAVWVLVVDNLTTASSSTRFGDLGPARRHVSVHADYDTADLLLQDLISDHLTESGDIDTVTASILARAIGDDNLGDEVHHAGVDTVPVLAAALHPLPRDPSPTQCDLAPTPSTAIPVDLDMEVDRAPTSPPSESAKPQRFWDRWLR